MTHVDWIINLLFRWQTLAGSLFVGLITVGSVASVFFKLYFDKERKSREKFGILIAILYELKMFIVRCEMHIGFYYGTPQKKSYNKYVLKMMNNISLETLFVDFDPKIYGMINNIYSVAETIKDNFDKSEVLHSIPSINPVTGVKSTTQISEIDDTRYAKAVAFIRWYLEDIYKQYNIICKHVEEYAKNKKYEFPDDLKRYSKKHVDERIDKWKLDLGKLDGH